MEVIFANLDLILAGAVVLISAVVLARRGQIKLLRELVLSLVVGAEVDFGGGTGEIKKSEVMKKVYELLPSMSKYLISESTVSELIENAKNELDELTEKKAEVKQLVTKESE